ncbi:hypothetical protein [Mesorhizobium sp. WSM4313]|uniref:hypothetical protein n=1 Tax=Mesorhizobium sp. WSM4313 TaxID=2029412 RepID=UPI001596B4E3|nr:hypothetical protein [Mesorhizobium sp. WSM4313]
MTEIEVDGIGTYRLPTNGNTRLGRLRGEKRHTAVGFGLPHDGAPVRQAATRQAAGGP